MTSTQANRPNAAPLQVIALGLGRTGTLSLRDAVTILQLDPTYHMFNLIRAGSVDAPIWQNIDTRVKNGEDPTELLDLIFNKSHTRTVMDYPAARFPQQLYNAYPNAKFILTVRDPIAWHKSAVSTIYAIHEPMWTLSWFLPCAWRQQNMCDQLLWGPQGFHKGRLVEDGPKQFVEHTENVKCIVPKDKLLIFDVKEGWEPLCQFLNVPVPLVPFPHSNDTAFFKKFIRIARINARIVQMIVTLVAIGIVYKIFSHLNLQNWVGF